MKNPVLLFGVDDVYPRYGFGDLNDGKLNSLLTLAKDYKLKITLFVVPDYIYKQQFFFLRKMQKILGKDFKFIYKKLIRKYKEGTFRIDKYKDWCSFLRKNSKYFEVAAHGCTHFSEWLDFPAEFSGLNINETSMKIKKCLDVFKKAGFKVRGFAPPGWGITKELLTSLKKNRFKYIAGSFDPITKISKKGFSNCAGFKNVSLIYKTKTNNILNIPRNIDIGNINYERANEIIKCGGIIGLHAHMGKTKGIINFISSKSIEELKKFLNYMKNKNIKKKFFREI